MNKQQLADYIQRLRAKLQKDFPNVYRDCYAQMSDHEFLVDIQNKQRTMQKFCGRPISLTRKFGNGDLEQLGTVTIQHQSQN
jgi:hypothetical protein